MPCVSATAAVYRETNIGWMLFVAFWTTGLAYIVATVFYQVCTFGQHPAFSLMWIVGSLVFTGCTLVMMKLAQPVRLKSQQQIT